MTAHSTWWTPWRTPRWVYIAVWLLFLLYPINGVARSDHSTATKAIGLVLIGAFAAVYLLASVYLMTGATLIAPRGAWAFAVLLALACGLLPILDAGAFSLAPFLMALATYSFTTRAGVIWVVALIIASVVIPRLAGWPQDGSVIVILLAVGVAMIGFRLIATREGERERAEESQRQLDAQLAVVAERERVAREVHDILGHSLTIISLKTELAQRLIPMDPARAEHEIAEANQLTRDALGQVRASVGRMLTPALPDTISSAESALRAAGVDAHLPGTDVQTPHAELFAWVLREAVTNVVRHSGARRCDVEIDETSISVRDNGHGMGSREPGNGLRGLTERVESAGGQLLIESDSAGTTLTALLTDPGVS